jgi:hypothetical protein
VTPAFIWISSGRSDQCGSHYPVVLTGTAPLPAAAPPRWKLRTADWQAYAEACSDQLTEVVNTMEAFTNILVQIANNSIPKTKITVHQKNKPWFNKDCKAAINERVAALQKFKRNPSANNLDSYKMARAKARRTIRTNKRDSWRQYVSRLNHKTPLKKVWDMVRRISGKHLPNPIKQLNINNTLC